MSNPNPIKRPMTALMAMALGDITDRGGEIVRHQGGYWTYPGALRSGVLSNPFDWWVNTPTIEGLVRRGELTYVEWREGRKGQFPIRARLTSAEPSGDHG